MADIVTDEEYQKGLDALSSLISGHARADGKNWSHAFDMMKVYLERLNLDKDLPKLSVIHVAGTKGKGSTCAMIERILREAGYKTGLYTSPHLVDVRERIRINGAPVDKSTFLRHIWSTLSELDTTGREDGGKPAYFRFLTLMGFRIFLEANVDVAILEVGLGGRLDATNCIRKPVVCGIAPLGFDHMEVLGHTLPEIAREKAGIFKPETPAWTVPQREDAAQALVQVAHLVGAPLMTVQPLDSYRCRMPTDDEVTPTSVPATQLQLGLAGQHQRQNAALAVTLAAEWEARSDAAAATYGQRALDRARDVLCNATLPREYVAGLQSTIWPGRGQIVADPCTSPGPGGGRLTFYLDGAHTAESMATCAHWFADATAPPPVAAGEQVHCGQSTVGTHRILLFNCMQERDPTALLQPLAATLSARGAFPPQALFVPPESTYMKLGKSDEGRDLSWQLNLRQVWSTLLRAKNGGGEAAGFGGPFPRMPPLPTVPGIAVQDAAVGAVLPNLQATLEWLRRCARETPSVRMQVLVTGSLYLVGDVLRLLGSK